MSSAPITCFMLEDMRIARYHLRRYAGGERPFTEGKCPSRWEYHNAMSGVIAEVPEDPEKPYTGTRPPQVDHADQRWPVRCECGYAFVEADAWQVFADGLYRRADTRQVLTWEEAPAGAVRDVSWWPDKGADGHAWVIKLPDGSEFMTEQAANNCKCPPDSGHRCWQRTGVAPALTISPSIATPKWHGFLRNGVLTGC